MPARYGEVISNGYRIAKRFWRESEVNDRLQDVMDHSFEQVVRYAETHGVKINRIAAYIVAIDRVARALRLREYTRKFTARFYRGGNHVS